MKKTIAILTLLSGLVVAGCEDTDVGMATQAGIEAVKAVTLDDEDVQRLAAAVAAQADRQHDIAPPGNPYAERLRRLTAAYGRREAHTFDFRVYLSPQVNAFAMADGSIRIYSGLMDLMDDDELLFVVGHEMGHVVENHIKEKLRLAYAGSAVRKAIASQRNEAGQIARSVLGSLAQNLVNAQFSQQDEREADDFGLRFIRSGGLGEQAAISAMLKLASLGGGHSFLSSHPAPEARAERLRESASAPEKAEAPSLWRRIIAWFKALWPLGGDERAYRDPAVTSSTRATTSIFHHPRHRPSAPSAPSVSSPATAPG